MSHILNKLTGVTCEDVKKQLEMDAASHTEQGMYLEHLWINSDNTNEVLFLFRVEDLNRCKEVVDKIYAAARKENPDIQLPEKIYLKEIV